MKITGIESTILCFLARKPEYLVQFAGSLGPDAFEVAQYLAGVTGVSAPARATGEAYLQWAKYLQCIEGVEHNIEYCLRTSECDDAVCPEACTRCTALSPCRECCCGATQTHKIVLRAIQVIDEAAQ